MKKISWFLILLLIPLVYAEPTSINVLNLEYNNEDINILEKFSTIGYYPDRNIQPEKGYLLKIMSQENTILYSFRFLPPTTEYLDGFDGTYNLGRSEISNKLNFSLIIPSFENEKEILIVKEGEQMSYDLTESNKGKIMLGGLLILIIIFFFLAFKKKKKVNPEEKIIKKVKEELKAEQK
ncbi:hypothetical protein HN592_05030 [Candidatus Woesearchaeota archaeon]|jgi:hypothetical protein|nr:hypothetical protein [Candidatus Woesearchaeota archaeon]MBT4367750.1 hypothetical protein [Candidatus Woesearchaeota archaeon]MBT4712238.1 hypothetical protein [Candidatus Woesearchaeota archaeon]MBT6638786.1 hypothetical protein [Candidatus Woesearchaeota archaeon]MBT7134430.1 hypothetical protein [Candidatus Woesearchaeota archaeon]